jgi:hypothetical protein
MALDFLAQASVCKQAVEKALPVINQTYQENFNEKDLIGKIGSSDIFQAQKTIRAGKVLGLSETADNSIIDALAQAIPEMYDRTL